MGLKGKNDHSHKKKKFFFIAIQIMNSEVNNNMGGLGHASNVYLEMGTLLIFSNAGSPSTQILDMVNTSLP